MPASFGILLVLYVDCRNADPLLLPYGATDIEDPAVARVGIRDDRHIHRGDDPEGVGDHLRHGGQPKSGCPTWVTEVPPPVMYTAGKPSRATILAVKQS